MVLNQSHLAAKISVYVCTCMCVCMPVAACVSKSAALASSSPCFNFSVISRINGCGFWPERGYGAFPEKSVSNSGAAQSRGLLQGSDRQRQRRLSERRSADRERKWLAREKWKQMGFFQVDRVEKAGVPLNVWKIKALMKENVNLHRHGQVLTHIATE